MSYRQGFQSSRFELKYVISETCARGIRDFARPYLVPDEHARRENGYAYPVFSLYLDSPALALYEQTVLGLKNRFKLRIRLYDDDPASPAFLEIKRRVTDVICKQRATVTRDGVRRLLDGRMAATNGNGHGQAALLDFCRLRDSIRAVPTAYTCYTREAYVSPESSHVRVTFDRQLYGSGYDRAAGLSAPPEGCDPRVGGVVLELKFTDRFPCWMRDLVQVFDLQRRSVPKYIKCVRAIGLHRRWPPGGLGVGRAG